ncbi:hypothetical protein CYMTET_32340 [Cymbomonas tetramitiformis]|uniref:Piezo non-specific cation channel cap domain-containing protein n=1 Tax=Cymbomonas tetramitiformis TaxID=36881 RepID=A0AAE0FF89_9CHLO|nr:hypothetical protein CYMTET_32340 [Cymbomonas tetramitiformis]
MKPFFQEVVVISDEVSSGLFATISNRLGGVYGVYVVFVLAVSAWLRTVTWNIRLRIPFEDLPSTARLEALCGDIYAMRLAGEFALEDELYWTLIRIYRTPAVLFEFTRKTEAAVDLDRPPQSS